MLYLQDRKYINENEVEKMTIKNGGCTFYRNNWFSNCNPTEIDKLDGEHNFSIIIPTVNNKNSLENINLNVSFVIDYHILTGTWFSSIENKIIYDKSHVINCTCNLSQILDDVKEIGKNLSQEAMGIIVDEKGLLIV